MRAQKLLHRFSLMPFGPIDIQPDRISPQTPVEVLQNSQKTLAVCSYRGDHAAPSQQRSHSAGKVQTGTMATGRGNPQPFPSLGPASTQPWVQGETALVLKNYCFTPTQALQFFLALVGIAGRPQRGPADNCTRTVSSDSPTGASNTVPAEPSNLSRSAASRRLPRWGRPSGRGLNPAPAGTSPGPSPRLDAVRKSVGKAVRPSGEVLEPPHRGCLSGGSSDSSSCGSSLGRPQSNPDADSPGTATTPQSSDLPRPPEPARPGPAIVPWWRKGELDSIPRFVWVQISIRHPICNKY
jgi:hypothetical protein